MAKKRGWIIALNMTDSNWVETGRFVVRKPKGQQLEGGLIYMRHGQKSNRLQMFLDKSYATKIAEEIICSSDWDSFDLIPVEIHEGD